MKRADWLTQPMKHRIVVAQPHLLIAMLPQFRNQIAALTQHHNQHLKSLSNATNSKTHQLIKGWITRVEQINIHLRGIGTVTIAASRLDQKQEIKPKLS